MARVDPICQLLSRGQLLGYTRILKEETPLVVMKSSNSVEMSAIGCVSAKLSAEESVN